jgi:hypothetical protein
MIIKKLEFDIMDDRAVDTENGLTEIVQELKNLEGVTSVEVVALKGRGSGWPTVEVEVQSDAVAALQELANRFADGNVEEMLQANALL